jgi:hypothetical protein
MRMPGDYRALTSDDHHRDTYPMGRPFDGSVPRYRDERDPGQGWPAADTYPYGRVPRGPRHEIPSRVVQMPLSPTPPEPAEPPEPFIASIATARNTNNIWKEIRFIKWVLVVIMFLMVFTTFVNLLELLKLSSVMSITTGSF